MARGKPAQKTLVQTVESNRKKTKHAPAEAPDAPAEAPDDVLDRLLDRVEAHATSTAAEKKAAPLVVSLRMARVHTVARRAARSPSAARATESSRRWPKSWRPRS